VTPSILTPMLALIVWTFVIMSGSEKGGRSRYNVCSWRLTQLLLVIKYGSRNHTGGEDGQRRACA